MKILCDKCGFETTLVCCDGVLRRDIGAHGNEAAAATCFNCNAELQVPGSPAVTAVAEPEPEPAEELAPVKGGRKKKIKET